MIAELVARGHRVSYAVPESFAPIAASAGAVPVVYRSVLPDEEAGQRWPEGGVEAMSIFLDEAALPGHGDNPAGRRPSDTNSYRAAEPELRDRLCPDGSP